MLSYDVTIETEFATILANEQLPTADEVGELIANTLDQEDYDGSGGEFTIRVTACDNEEVVEDEP